MIYLDLSGLDEKLADDCELFFQEKMEQSDGNRCLLTMAQFKEIKLTQPSLQSQQVLNFFANSSCPFSMMRFAASLFPYSSKKWPIKSYELSQLYMLKAIEAVINIRYDKIVREEIEDYQSGKEFKGIMLIAHEIIDRVAVQEHICPEVCDFIMDRINMTTVVPSRTVQ